MAVIRIGHKWLPFAKSFEIPASKILTRLKVQIDSLNQVIRQLQGRQTIYMDGGSPGTNKAPQAIAAVIWNENSRMSSAVDPLSLPHRRLPIKITNSGPSLMVPRLTWLSLIPMHRS